MTENSTSADEGPACQGPAAQKIVQQASAERSAGFVLYAEGERGRRYLLLRHSYGGHWGPPKGHIEAGESETQAALRETREETGFQNIKPIHGFRAVSRYYFTRNHRTVFKEAVYFLGRVALADPALSREHTGAKWLAYNEALASISYDDTRDILTRAEAWLKNGSAE